MAKEIENRIVAVKLMMARGYTQETIQDTLELTDKQMRDDKAKIEAEKGDMLEDEDILKTFNWYRNISKQVIEDLQVAVDTSDSTASTVSALRSKEQIASNIIKVAQEMGMLPKIAEKTEHQGTHNVVVRIEDKKTIIDLITKHIGGENTKRD